MLMQSMGRRTFIEPKSDTKSVRHKTAAKVGFLNMKKVISSMISIAGNVLFPQST